MNSRSLVLIGAACLAGAAIPAVASAAWTAPPTTISFQPANPLVATGSASDVSLAMDTDGVATATWTQSPDGFSNDIAYAARMVDGSWSPPASVSPYGGMVSGPAVAVGTAGTPQVAWLRFGATGPNRSVEANRYAGGRWTGATSIAPEGANGHLQIASDGADSATAVWTHLGGQNYALQSSRSLAGAWSAAGSIAGTTSAQDFAPIVASGAPGEVVVVWGTVGGVPHAVTSTNGVWGAVTDLPVVGATALGIALNASGTGAITWSDGGVVHASRRSGGGWGVAVAVSPIVDIDESPVATIDGSGVITVAWVRMLVDGTHVVQAARSTATGWSSPVDISAAEPAATNVRVAIAANAAGQVTVLWNGDKAGLGVMRASTRTVAGWSDPAVIGGPRAAEGTSADSPFALAADSLGRVSAAWLWNTAPQFNVVQAARLQGVPGAPTAASGTAGNASVEVKWAAPADNGSSPITGYRVTATPGGATCASTTTTCRVAGLTNGASYTFTVAAANVIGTGPESSATAAVRPDGTTPPRVVGRLKATIKVRNRVVTTTGSVAAGVTKVTQKATATKKKARTAKCRILAAPRTGADRAYRCTMRIPAARWSITTEARDRLGVVARSVRSVRVR